MLASLVITELIKQTVNVNCHEGFSYVPEIVALLAPFIDIEDQNGSFLSSIGENARHVQIFF